MLDSLRRGAASWFAKGLLGLLAIAFAVWGVPHDFLRWFNPDSVAIVGGKEISPAEFQRAYQIQLDQIRRRFGGRITAEQARAFGLDNQVLAQLIGSTAIEQHAQKLGLALSDDTIKDLVRQDPTFKGPDGKFSQAQLNSILREAGYSEIGYLAARRRDEVRDQIIATLGTVQAPAPLVDIVYRYREETRTASYFVVAPDKVKVGTPDETKLKETWEANKAKFVVPEYRQVAALLVTVDGVAKTIDVPAADVQAAYDQTKDQYAVPERRRILQIAYPDRAAAEAALKAIKAGQSFADAAKAAGAKESDIDLGVMTRNQVIDPKIADAAFALEKGKVSDVVEGRFATVLLQVNEIQPGRQKPFDEVKGEIKDRIAKERAAEQVQKLHDQIDDSRAGGKSTADIAREMKLPITEVKAIDGRGNGPDGKPALPDNEAGPVATIAFATPVNQDAEPVEVGDSGYAWVRVLAITPERQKPLEEVKSEVEALWAEQERKRLVSDLAAKLAERANAGEAFDKLAAEGGGKLEVAKDFKRFGAQPGLGETGITQAFALAKGKTGTADTQDGRSRLVIRVDAVNTAGDPPKAEAEKLAGDVSRQMQNDVLAAYVAALQEQIGVRINQAGLRAATGANSQAQ